MTELTLQNENPVTTVEATPLAGYLTASGSSPATDLASYLGVLTPRQLDASEAETDALLSGAGLHDLGWLRRIAVRGEDRLRWLSGMVTNAVETLPDGRGAYNLVLNAQGRIQGDCYVLRDGDALELEVTAGQAEALMTHLDRFIIMDDVELAPISGQTALGLTGSEAESMLQKLGLAVPTEELSSTSGTLGEIPVRLIRGYGTLTPHFELWAEQEQVPALWQALLGAGATAVGATSLETLRIAEGIPAYGVDIQSRDLAQETAQDRALNFTKGCYLGQEIVERIRSRGQVHRHLRSLELTSEELTADNAVDLPIVGTELRVSGSAPEAKPAGALTSVAAVQLQGVRRIFAIAMIRAEAEIGNRPLEYAGGMAHILHTPPKLT
jgi:folate-binding protein YgfZ